MRKLSKWAKNNPWSSRIIIVISHILVVLNAVFLGVMLFVFDWETSEWPLLLLANVFFALYFFYPKKGDKNGYWCYSYARQKAHDFGLVLSYGAIIVLWVNSFCTQQDYHHNIAPPAATAKFMVLTPNVPSAAVEQSGWYANTKEKFRSSKKELKRELRALKKELRRSDNAATGVGVKILLIFLTVLGALLLATVIAFLACALGCSGSGALAGVVVIAGLGGIVWLSIIIIMKILKKQPSDAPKFY